MLKRRLQAALDYIDAHPDENFPIIVSGAQGQNELETEAQAMETYLVSHGVDKAVSIRRMRPTTPIRTWKTAPRCSSPWATTWPTPGS